MSKKRIIYLIVIGLLLSGISVFATYLIDSSDVEFDNTTANLPDSNGDETISVQEAIDELFTLYENNVNSEMYTVNFNTQGGTDINPNIPYKYATLPTSTKSGYYFAGWYDAAEGGNKITTDTVIDDNTTVYAHWIEGTNDFSTDSCEAIKVAVETGIVESIYSVGDTRTVTLEGTGDLGNTYTVRLSNNSHYDCKVDNVELESKTACGFVVEFVDIITKRVINTNVSGYSNLGSLSLDDIFNVFPSDLRNVIANTTVVSGHGTKQSSNKISTAKLYLLSGREVTNYTGNFDTAQDATRQLDYYEDNEVTTSNYEKAVKKYNGTATAWWLRSAYAYDANSYLIYANNGSHYYSRSDYNNGVSPAFRIE